MDIYERMIAAVESQYHSYVSLYFVMDFLDCVAAGMYGKDREELVRVLDFIEVKKTALEGTKTKSALRDVVNVLTCFQRTFES